MLSQTDIVKIINETVRQAFLKSLDAITDSIHGFLSHQLKNLKQQILSEVSQMLDSRQIQLEQVVSRVAGQLHQTKTVVTRLQSDPVKPKQFKSEKTPILNLTPVQSVYLPTTELQLPTPKSRASCSRQRKSIFIANKTQTNEEQKIFQSLEKQRKAFFDYKI